MPGRGSLGVAQHCEAPDGGGSLRSASCRRIDDSAPAGSARTQGRRRKAEDHVWFEDRWMVASLCDE
jgi:hypothetical protein